MAREKKPVHKVQMEEGKRNNIQMLLLEYDIKPTQDIQEALKDLLGGTIKEMMEAETEEKVQEALERVIGKWSEKYPNSMKNWRQNWDAISMIFKFFAGIRKVIYTTNAIESLNVLTES